VNETRAVGSVNNIKCRLKMRVNETTDSKGAVHIGSDPVAECEHCASKYAVTIAKHHVIDEVVPSNSRCLIHPVNGSKTIGYKRRYERKKMCCIEFVDDREVAGVVTKKRRMVERSASLCSLAELTSISHLKAVSKETRRRCHVEISDRSCQNASCWQR
jgi:hypothetical protein